MSRYKLYCKDEKEMKYNYLKSKSANAPKTLTTGSDNRFVAENPEKNTKVIS